MAPARSLIAAPHPPGFLHAHLLTADQWRPCPPADERDAWQHLPAAHRDALVAAGETALAQPWATLPASLWLYSARTGNRSRFQEAYFGRRQQLITLAIAECVEGRGRFVEAAVEGIWFICEESSWCLPAHLSMQTLGFGLPDHEQPTVDLFAAETAAALAWIDWLLRAQLDAVHPLVRRRLRFEVDRRVMTPCLVRDDFWWLGWHRGQHPVNNWNPWCNSNWLTCVLLLEPDPDRRVAAVHKILRSLDVFLDFYPADGGCDEGPAYWGRAGASLFDCLELLHSATGGRIDLYAEPLVREIARYVMRAHIAGEWLLNFADAGARAAIEAVLVWRFGRRINDATLAAFGAWQHRHQPAPWLGQITSPGRLVANLFAVAAVEADAAVSPLLRDVWLPDLQVFVARDAAGTAEGFYLAAKGGHNEESHNHNDVGTFVVYLNGEPLFIDLGVETYTARTFSPQRYEIWTMQSSWHNLPEINGVQQAFGRQFAARDVVQHADHAAAGLQLNLAGAYPASAGIKRWTRSLRLERGGSILITDDYDLHESRTPVVFNFIAHQRPELLAEGRVGLSSLAGGHRAELTFDPEAFSTIVEVVEVTDPQLQKAWGAHVHRLRLTENRPAQSARHEFRINRTALKTMP